MQVPADARLSIYLLEILARESVIYRTPDRFASRARKAWHRISTEQDCVRPDQTPGVWHVRSERRALGWHTVSPYELSCDCEDRNLRKYRPTRTVRRYYDFKGHSWKGRTVTEGVRQQPPALCHHVLMAAFAEAGRLAAEASGERSQP